MDAAMPDGWEKQVIRAYEVFGVSPAGEDTEFGGRLWKRLAKRALGHVTKPVKSKATPDLPNLNPAFERLHPRWDKGHPKGGEFKQKNGPKLNGRK